MGNSVGILIPAKDEAATVAGVARVALASGLGTVLVVSDGSIDATAERAREAGARVLELPKNLGKGGAVVAGARALETDLVMLVDADLIGLRPDHLRAMLEPIERGEADVTVGVFAGGRGATDLGQRFTPYLSGQRTVPRDLLLRVPGLETARYAIELAVTRQVGLEGLRVKYVSHRGLSQVMKEEKRGVLAGLAHRLKMYWQLASYAATTGRSGRP